MAPASENPLRDRWLVGIVCLSLCLNCFHLQWGLPNGNHSWAADANGPITVLGALHHSFARFNSGWFYFKYPLGYPLELAAIYSPYLAWLLLSGGWAQPSKTYPYGFADAEHTLFVLAMLGRLLSVCFVTGTVVLAYAIARRLFDVFAARIAAVLTATLYPLVYYAHTTNLDAGYMFWLILALHAAIVAGESARSTPWAVLGVAAAMAVSTKEQGFAFLLPLPMILVAQQVRSTGVGGVLRDARLWSMAGAAVVTVLFANNAIFNPLGFMARIAYLAGHPITPVDARLAPVEFSLFKGWREIFYLREMADCLDSGLGLPLALTALSGAIWSWWRPRAALWLLVPSAVHYYLSLRGLELIALRYVLPVLVTATILASGALAAAMVSARPRLRILGRTAGMCLIAFGVVRAAEMNGLLAGDPRYEAEAWIRENLPDGARGEVYQKPAFVPRFRDGRTARFVPMKDRSPDALRERRPDFVVLSSASSRSITQRWARDWHVEGMLEPVPEAQQMLRAIEDGSAGYGRAAQFASRPRSFRSRITSLSPSITVYVRSIGEPVR